jgi:hypothetical protein
MIWRSSLVRKISWRSLKSKFPNLKIYQKRRRKKKKIQKRKLIAKENQ